MNFALEAYFDTAADRRVRELWSRIAAAGLPSPLLRLGHTPHVSLAVAGELGPSDFAAALADFAAREAPLRIALATAATFGTRAGVVFLGAVATRPLLELHARLFPLFERAAADPWSHYRPGSWVPHCTVTSGVAPAQLGLAIQICVEHGLPIEATLEGVAIVENPPGKVHARFSFAHPAA